MEIGIQWPLVLFTLIAGAGYGLLATIGFVQFAGKQSKDMTKISLIGVLVLLGVGGLMSVFHLAHPERFMGAIANLLSFSGIALELIGLAFGGLAAILFLAFSFAGNKGGEKVVALCSIVIGVVAPFLHGYAYFEVAAQQGWDSASLMFCYLFTSLAAGSLVYVALACSRGEEETTQQLVGKVAAVLAVLATLSMVAYAAALGGMGRLENEAMLFAVLSVAFEVATLLAAAWFAFKKPSVSLAVSAALLGVAGGLVIRMLMWAVASYDLNLIWDAAVNRGLYLF